MTVEIAVADVVFRQDLYPRINTSAETVQKYAEDLDVLPPIEVNQHKELIDGWHRWTAHKKAGALSVRAAVTQTTGDSELLELAIERNAKFGHQLSNREKKKNAGAIYRATPQEERGAKKRRLAEILSVSYETVNNWLSRIDKNDEEEVCSSIQDMWLRCYTRKEISEKTGASEDVVRRVLGEIVKFQIPPMPGMFSDGAPDDSAPDKLKKEFEAFRLAKIVDHNKALAAHVSDFSVPVYNVWKQQTKSDGSSHFGNSESAWLDRLLYLYTSPFDRVVDPFGGGGSTLDVCRKRFRRCFISDRRPIEERSREIRKLDLVTDGLPDMGKNLSEVRLVYLDPPYWKQAEGRYSDDAEDLANMPLDEFHNRLAGIVNAFIEKLSARTPRVDGHVALILQPTQWKAPERQYTDHVAEMIRRVSAPIAMRIQAPYESQQCNAQMVEWAKENRQVLVLSREIVVWRA